MLVGELRTQPREIRAVLNSGAKVQFRVPQVAGDSIREQVHDGRAVAVSDVKHFEFQEIDARKSIFGLMGLGAILFLAAWARDIG